LGIYDDKGAERREDRARCFSLVAVSHLKHEALERLVVERFAIERKDNHGQASPMTQTVINEAKACVAARWPS
jgi:hypothetical protein